METSREDVGIAIRSAFLRKGTQQRFSLFVLVVLSIIFIYLETKVLSLIQINDCNLKSDTKFFFHDLLGRGGRSKNPQSGHFHPDIPRLFRAYGIREVKLSPQGHFFSPQEELNRDIQQMIAKLRKIFDEKRQDYGPQNFKGITTS